MAINYKLNGMGKLQKVLLERVSKDKIVSVVKRNTTQMQQTAMAKASSTYTKRDKHGKPYSTGDTKKSIGVSFENGGMSGTTGMGMKYNPYTEKGTRFMAAEPLLEPTFNSQKTKFKSDLENLIK
ncbi:HK97-gp10 family putative phage morphogenesis protein [Weissella paramesenteroides]|uniref:HK97-gp10 family putative phage morphogenesis protein n=1 Tax=Weissella paramesenteroides TaxID=1249 RepID=UPI0023F8FC9F|nr:HK97-gp10 family putative phage morphogenesis protein [Weissella paramesenteroides]MDF8373594.1 phage tail protein [Weissella paramesenteroides]WIG66580.1 phage tail protein [Weissella paramesenteroides]